MALSTTPIPASVSTRTLIAISSKASRMNEAEQRNPLVAKVRDELRSRSIAGDNDAMLHINTLDFGHSGQ